MPSADVTAITYPARMAAVAPMDTNRWVRLDTPFLQRDGSLRSLLRKRGKDIGTSFGMRWRVRELVPVAGSWDPALQEIA